MKFLFLLMLSFSAMAQDYVLSAAENEHYRDYTREEFLTRLGIEPSVLEHYACNGVNEFTLFWPARRENPKADSLRILGHTPESKPIFYREGRFYKLSGELEDDLSNRFVIRVKDALKEIEKVQEGAELLRHLERSYFPITIQLGGNYFNSKEETGAPWKGIYMATAIAEMDHGRMTGEDVRFYDIGVGGLIYWNPNNDQLPSYIVLAHEMFHGFDAIRGLLDSRFVKGEDYESTAVSEFRATYLENIMRRAAKIKLRTHYGDTTEGPGLLDAHGEPRLIPSPCLR